jgi:hypothetical protein
MNPVAVNLALSVIQLAIKYAPGLSAKLRDLFHKGEPTAEDWANLRSEVESTEFFDLVPNSKLPRN